MADYSRTILQSVLDTKNALLASLELVKEIEQLGPLEAIDYEILKPILEKYGQYAEPDRIETTRKGSYHTEPGIYTTDEQKYGHALYSWRINAKCAKMLSINPNYGN
jgi:hypothetical protein